MPNWSVSILCLLVGQVSGAQVEPAASEIDGNTAVRAAAVATSTVRPDPWRRTAQGWQRIDDWPQPQSGPIDAGVAHVHPLVVAALIGLISAAALLGFESPGRRHE